MQLAREAIAKENAVLTFEGVESVETQVVSGINFRLCLNFRDAQGARVQYTARVYAIPWQDFAEVTSVSRVENADGAASNPLSADLYENKDLQFSILKFCKEQLQMRVNRNLEGFEVTNFHVLSMQVVAGNTYTLQLELSNELQETVSYIVEVWSKPWMNPPLEIVSIKDAPVVSGRRVLQAAPGGFVDYTWNPEGELELSVLQAITEYAQKQNWNRFAPIEVTNVQTRVTANLIVTLILKYNVGALETAADVHISYNPRTRTSEILKFNTIEEMRQNVVAGNFKPYVWNPAGDLEIIVTKHIEDYAAEHMNANIGGFKIVNAMSKLVSGVSFKLIIQFELLGEPRYAEVDVYTQHWTQTYQVISFQLVPGRI